MNAQEEKRLTIIEAAIRRFGHFGIAKTTMAEIAADLSQSKASLYYYFPDKSSLFTAALMHAIGDTFDQVSDHIPTITKTEDALMFLLDKRMEFVTRHYKLFEHMVGGGQQPSKELAAILVETKRGQIELIKSILQRGIESGQLRHVDAEETAQIILYALEGMRFSILQDMDVSLFPTTEEFSTILHYQQKMIRILMKGLSAAPPSPSFLFR